MRPNSLHPAHLGAEKAQKTQGISDSGRSGYMKKMTRLGVILLSHFFCRWRHRGSGGGVICVSTSWIQICNDGGDDSGYKKRNPVPFFDF